MSRNNSGRAPIVCRFVPHDGWLKSHFSQAWSVRELKLVLLSQCLPGLVPAGALPPPPSRFRPASPVVFSRPWSPQSSLTVPDDVSPRHSTDSSAPAGAYIPDTFGAHRPRDEDAPGASIAAQYTLTSFATGQFLEDRLPLAWYNIHPHELVELCRANAPVQLRRSSPNEYVKPYFEARVNSARVIWSLFDVQARAVEELRNPHQPNTLQRGKKKEKLESSERWAVIRNGVLTLTGKRTDEKSLYAFDLSTLSTLSTLKDGADMPTYPTNSSSSRSRAPSLTQESSSSGSSPYTLCLQFRSQYASSTSVPTPTSARSLSSRSVSVANSAPSSELGHGDPTSSFASDFSLSPAEGTWVILDLADAHAHAAMVRTLHRLASTPLDSVFLPSANPFHYSSSHHRRANRPRPRTGYRFPPASSSSSESDSDIDAGPLQSFHRQQLSRTTSMSGLAAAASATPFPEWRLEAISRARRAGLGIEGGPLERVILANYPTRELPDASTTPVVSPPTTARSSVSDQPPSPRRTALFQTPSSPTKSTTSQPPSAWRPTRSKSVRVRAPPPAVTWDVFDACLAPPRDMTSTSSDDDNPTADDADSDGSVREWENWADDLSRQAAVRAASSAASSSAAISSPLRTPGPRRDSDEGVFAHGAPSPRRFPRRAKTSGDLGGQRFIPRWRTAPSKSAPVPVPARQSSEDEEALDAFVTGLMERTRRPELEGQRAVYRAPDLPLAGGGEEEEGGGMVASETVREGMVTSDTVKAGLDGKEKRGSAESWAPGSSKEGKGKAVLRRKDSGRARG